MQAFYSFLAYTAYKLRVSSVNMSAVAGSGHPSSCLSAADIVTVLFFYAMRFDPDNFEHVDNDRFILSKGHASALLYAVWKELGKLTEQDLLTYRQFDSVLEGHPTFRFPFTEAATGALGTGLSIALGQALAARMANKQNTIYVLLGDGEMAEGANWEAIQLARHYQVDNLVAIVDFNRLAQSGPVMLHADVEKFKNIMDAHGWQTQLVDGHSIDALISACDGARIRGKKPHMIIAQTIKGYGIDFVQNRLNFHGKAFMDAELTAALADLQKNFFLESKPVSYTWTPRVPERTGKSLPAHQPIPDDMITDIPAKIATRKAYGKAVAQLGDVDTSIICLDADVKNSTYAEIFEQRHPHRFVQCYVAEQNMVGMAIGFARRGYIPFVSTFASFFTRAHDHIRMAAIGRSALRLVGSHAGVSIGQDGPSQMALEDIAMMRCLPDSVVLYPCDGVSALRLTQVMAQYHDGISYLRTTRAETETIYGAADIFVIGGSKILRQSEYDRICIIAAGITVYEALKAYEHCKNLATPIMISIIDCYSIKPLDVATVIAVARTSGGKIITVEDHYIQGGLGQVVAAAVVNTSIRVKNLAVTELPRSGSPEELLAWARIDAQAIIAAVLDFV